MNYTTATVVFQSFFGVDLFFDDEDENVKPERLPKVEHFAEVTVPRFNNQQFQRHFRMSATTFESVVYKINEVAGFHVSKGHPECEIGKQLMITLWYLGNIESFR